MFLVKPPRLAFRSIPLTRVSTCSIGVATVAAGSIVGSTAAGGITSVGLFGSLILIYNIGTNYLSLYVR